MRTLALALLVGFACSAEQSDLKYSLRTPKGWDVWGLTDTSDAARSAYTFAGDGESKDYIQGKIKAGVYTRYKPGDVVVRTGEEDGDVWRVRIIEGTSVGGEGWVHRALLDMTEESKAYVEKLEQRERIADANRRAAAKRSAEDKKRAADEARRKELEYIDSLPKLIGPSEDVLVATSFDCAKDLQNTVIFGRKNGTGVEFRKKVLELMTLGCAVTMVSGTPMEHATRDGQFVTFTAYKSGKRAVALSENVRWR
ncbi:MAG: hypothetical protein ABSB67_19820 [Bryobacteraceae bacterium]|jgi:hypothetical protein